jgi:hypothetical protein
VVCDHYLQTTQAPFVGGSVICLNTGCGTIGGPATALLFHEMTFLQRKGGTKGALGEPMVGFAERGGCTFVAHQDLRLYAADAGKGGKLLDEVAEQVAASGFSRISSTD